MRRALTLQKELGQIGTIQDLTSVFEAIASMHIAQIKDRVVSSTAFFNELWAIYRQLRVSEVDHIAVRPPATIQRPVIMLVTSDGGLIGDIDERIVNAMVAAPHDGADIVAVGAHAATLLAQKGLKAALQLPMPEVESGAGVIELAKHLGQYSSATVYYQTYVSLTRQEVATLDLFLAVESLGDDPSQAEAEIISSTDYIFEPSLSEITAYMESVMLEIAVGQVLLESKLAQYASRFNAMTAAKNRANDMSTELQLALNRAHRAEADERTREVVSARKVIA